MADEFRVLKIDEVMKMGDLGRPERVYRVAIKTKGGTTLTVEIEEGDFTEEKARAIMAARAQEADKILKLRS